MKKVLVFLMLGLLLTSSGVLAQGARPESSEPVTQAVFAELMVRALGLVRFLPAGATSQQMFDVLMQNGIVPEDGWKLDAVLTKADFARVLVQAMRLEEMVDNPEDPQSWINALREQGVEIGRLGETIQVVEALPEAMGQIISAQSTDPLIQDINFVPGATIQYSVPLEVVSRILTHVEMSQGQFRPIPPTPH